MKILRDVAGSEKGESKKNGVSERTWSGVAALEILNVTLSSYGLLNRQVPVYFAPSGPLKQAGIPFYESHVKIGARRDRPRQTLETKISEREITRR